MSRHEVQTVGDMVRVYYGRGFEVIAVPLRTVADLLRTDRGPPQVVPGMSFGTPALS